MAVASQLPTLALLCLALCLQGSVHAARSTLKPDSTNAGVHAHQQQGDDGAAVMAELMKLRARTDALEAQLELKKGKEDDKHEPYGKMFCDRKEYRKHTLKVIKEAPFVGLFNDLRNITRFEGSAITYAKGYYWAIFDSLRAIARINLGFNFREESNILVPEDKGEYESQFEGLQYSPSTDTFLAARETAVYKEHGGFVPQIEEIKMADDHKEWTLIRKCPVRFTLESENKGWESIVYYDGKNGERFLLGLCESNYCKTSSGDDAPGNERGNGRLVLSQFKDGDEETKGCHWDTLKVINLPEEAYFKDYSGISFNNGGHGPRVAVVSQEDAAVWVGEFNWDKLEFEGEGEVQHFPRDAHCNILYCNVEGVTWLDDERFIFASDASKSVQGHECMDHDQSVVIAALAGRMPDPIPDPNDN